MTAAPALGNDLTNIKQRQAAIDEKLDVLADIYDDDVNIAVWQRLLPNSVLEATSKVLLEKPDLQISLALDPADTREVLVNALGMQAESAALVTDVAGLVDMFCYLFDLKNVGLRLTALGHTMCPRFHVDKVPCRLATTYFGNATEWLPHDRIDRSKLGPGSRGKPDAQSGLFSRSDDIQQLDIGDVALLKGESWIGNEEAGLVHRSPGLQPGTLRLLLTLDFAHTSNFSSDNTKSSKHMSRIVPISEIWGESEQEGSSSGHTLQGGVEFH